MNYFKIGSQIYYKFLHLSLTKNEIVRELFKIDMLNSTSLPVKNKFENHDSHILPFFKLPRGVHMTT